MSMTSFHISPFPETNDFGFMILLLLVIFTIWKFDDEIPTGIFGVKRDAHRSSNAVNSQIDFSERFHRRDSTTISSLNE